ncbi:MAG: hypothetical protein HY696_09020 [Deltaproteobacteria bacterium]|nr:hypothetical protein [Deltaproteobacteria bacterium]
MSVKHSTQFRQTQFVAGPGNLGGPRVGQSLGERQRLLGQAAPAPQQQTASKSSKLLGIFSRNGDKRGPEFAANASFAQGTTKTGLQALADTKAKTPGLFSSDDDRVAWLNSILSKK